MVTEELRSASAVCREDCQAEILRNLHMLWRKSLETTLSVSWSSGLDFRKHPCFPNGAQNRRQEMLRH